MRATRNLADARPVAAGVQTLLSVLTRARLVELGRDLGVSVPERSAREAQLDLVARASAASGTDLLRFLNRDELRSACRALKLDFTGRSRSVLMDRLRAALGEERPGTRSPRSTHNRNGLPVVGDVVQVRHRQWLVDQVVPPVESGEKGTTPCTLVRAVCLDDDNTGAPLELLWELELGAKVVAPETHGLGTPRQLDEPRRFGAFLHTVKWNAVTAADARLLQAPFRAGIRLMSHQLAPLRKALELPRANLFIADDVGLGKTIEAGLVLQELLLRQRVEFVLIVCPAAVALQWKDEMDRRFGLSFELMTREFIARRRQERGFQVNPWSTHQRFIVSYPTVRRPEYRDPLLQHLGDRARKSLLILDEAHTAAPATASKYAVDSEVTRVIRDVAPRFENRLFLSATPHNGHSNSFAALLELLDPQRFTRGVPVRDPKRLEPVLIRRLKDDLTAIGVAEFPKRLVRAIELRHGAHGWSMQLLQRGDDGRSASALGPATALGPGDRGELTLSELLAEYRATLKGVPRRGRRALVVLQKRLLSSVEAFARTLAVHERALLARLTEGPTKTGAARADPEQLSLGDASSPADDSAEYGLGDEELAVQQQADVERASLALPSPAARALELLSRMKALGERQRNAPDAKALALVAWMREHQCEAIRIGGADPKRDARWTDRRVIVFTEWVDTKRYLDRLLTTAIEGTDRAEERILELHGGMSDDQRAEVQRAWNTAPDQHPVRILLATDSAREGLNLQAHCADLFHYDLPWNPARLDQRNGRIDRTLQPEREVRCHYFHYPQRREDAVLDKLIQKVETIRKELGSLSAVLMDRLAEVLEDGIDAATAVELDRAEADGGERAVVEAELEGSRRREAALRAEIEEAGELVNASRKLLDYDPELLRDALDAGLSLVAPGVRLEPLNPEHSAFRVPELPASWVETLDSLRPPRERDQPLSEWRKRPLDPVVFQPPAVIESGRVHLHLEHPFVRRVLSRFRAQGYSAYDLSRVTLLRNRHDSLVRAIAFGRLSLFGPAATRLHDEVLSIAARWTPGEAGGKLRPFADEADRKAIQLFESILADAPELKAIPEAARRRCLEAAPALFGELWDPLREEAEHRAHQAERKLRARGRSEADALRGILEQQRAAIRAEMRRYAQQVLSFDAHEREQREQHEHDRAHMQQRLSQIDAELDREPAELEALYGVALTRIEPVGLAILWPETRA